jgi:hypothetical protein
MNHFKLRKSVRHCDPAYLYLSKTQTGAAYFNGPQERFGFVLMTGEADQARPR